MTEEKKEPCLICAETPGWVFIQDPREAQPERKRCPNRCDIEKGPDERP